ncbi:hypothetical protein [Streptomyces phaeoluteigriseus]|uniref:hypothetical protein n=1 Tax=Streptomyces phaeoluteigriseus TaxID=114686 RepID=UPI0036BFAAB9
MGAEWTRLEYLTHPRGGLAGRIGPLAHQRALGQEEPRRRSTGAACLPASVTGRQALPWATAEGARTPVLADRVGRIEPGMQADLVDVDTLALNP